MRQLVAAHRSVTSAWLLLLAATGIITVLTETGAIDGLVTTLVLIVASAKVLVVLVEFMELRTAPRPWRLPFAIWLVAVSGVAIAGFL